MVITYDSEGTKAPGTWRPDGNGGVLVTCPACKARTLTINAEDIKGERTEIQCKCGLNELGSIIAFDATDLERHRPQSDIGEPRTGGEIADELDPDRVRSGDELPDK